MKNTGYIGLGAGLGSLILAAAGCAGGPETKAPDQYANASLRQVKSFVEDGKISVDEMRHIARTYISIGERLNDGVENEAHKKALESLQSVLEPIIDKYFATADISQYAFVDGMQPGSEALRSSGGRTALPTRVKQADFAKAFNGTIEEKARLLSKMYSSWRSAVSHRDSSAIDKEKVLERFVLTTAERYAEVLKTAPGQRFGGRDGEAVWTEEQQARYSDDNPDNGQGVHYGFSLVGGDKPYDIQEEHKKAVTALEEIAEKEDKKDKDKEGEKDEAAPGAGVKEGDIVTRGDKTFKAVKDAEGRIVLVPHEEKK